MWSTPAAGYKPGRTRGWSRPTRGGTGADNLGSERQSAGQRAASLALLNNNLRWMEKLGAAFLDQQPAVMELVQRLRQMAVASGNPATNQQQTVLDDNGLITITLPIRR